MDGPTTEEALHCLVALQACVTNSSPPVAEQSIQNLQDQTLGSKGHISKMEHIQEHCAIPSQ